MMVKWTRKSFLTKLVGWETNFAAATAAEYLSKKNSVGRVGWSSFSLKFSHGAKKTFIFVCSASTDY